MYGESGTATRSKDRKISAFRSNPQACARPSQWHFVQTQLLPYMELYAQLQNNNSNKRHALAQQQRITLHSFPTCICPPCRHMGTSPRAYRVLPPPRQQQQEATFTGTPGMTQRRRACPGCATFSRRCEGSLAEVGHAYRYLPAWSGLRLCTAMTT